MSFAEFFSQIRWRPQIGDPSFMGWLTVAAYGLAAVLCFANVFRQPVADEKGQRNPRHLWLGLALLLSFLCINKQLDLQSLFTDIGRVLAVRGGWYEQRRSVQFWFVIAIAAAGFLALVTFAWRIRAVLRERILLLSGLIFLLTFIVVRAASFHHFDRFLGSRILGLRMNWILELSGIAMIAVSAIQSGGRPKKLD